MVVKVDGMLLVIGGVINRVLIGRVFFDKEIFVDGIGALTTDVVVSVDGLIDETVVTVTLVVVDNSTVDGEDVVSGIRRVP
ncbi:hypothetical protein NDU88_001359 [Pleurodeles waltl]|uniref:Uncharacterized protein n=1 Tax=Pleurodeles waltl TaxID=8319 RepID=A0AAV7S8R5_PLEWA|nr:hypothetical protein NDU88_001359 [Pleurodeles waltl]